MLWICEHTSGPHSEGSNPVTLCAFPQHSCTRAAYGVWAEVGSAFRTCLPLLLDVVMGVFLLTLTSAAKAAITDFRF